MADFSPLYIAEILFCNYKERAHFKKAFHTAFTLNNKKLIHINILNYSLLNSFAVFANSPEKNKVITILIDLCIEYYGLDPNVLLESSPVLTTHITSDGYIGGFGTTIEEPDYELKNLVDYLFTTYKYDLSFFSFVSNIKTKEENEIRKSIVNYFYNIKDSRFVTTNFSSNKIMDLLLPKLLKEYGLTINNTSSTFTPVVVTTTNPSNIKKESNTIMSSAINTNTPANPVNSNVAVQSITYIFGRPSHTVSNANIVDMIHGIESNIAQLSTIKAKSTTVASSIKAMKDDIKALVDVMDAR